LNIQLLTKGIVVYLAVLDLIFWIIAITVTVWGVGNGSMVENNPRYASLFANKGLVTGAFVFCLSTIVPVLICLGAYLASPFAVKKICTSFAETKENYGYFSSLFQGAFFLMAVIFLTIVGSSAIPDGLGDFMVLLKVLQIA
jgi:hypothetical protein